MPASTASGVLVKAAVPIPTAQMRMAGTSIPFEPCRSMRRPASQQVQGVVVSPAHQWPTGVVLSPQRRQALTNWAVCTDGWIIEDDYHAEFRYDRDPVGWCKDSPQSG